MGLVGAPSSRMVCRYLTRSSRPVQWNPSLKGRNAGQDEADSQRSAVEDTSAESSVGTPSTLRKSLQVIRSRR